jgi:hypothetical protein
MTGGLRPELRDGILREARVHRRGAVCGQRGIRIVRIPICGRSNRNHRRGDEVRWASRRPTRFARLKRQQL